MHDQRTRTTVRAVVWILLVLSVSAASLVLAQRVLTGLEVTTDGMTVARGEVDDRQIEIQALPDWEGDASVTLRFDDDGDDFAFGRRVDGEFIITTIQHGTEPIGDFLARLDLLYDEVAVASACELMSPDGPWFASACPAYDPKRRPPDHPEVEDLVCSTCHDPGEIESAYEQARGVVLFLDDDTVASADRAMPDGHLDVEGMTCSTCHSVTDAGESAGPVDEGAGRPAGHPDVAPGSCSTCHGGGGDTPTAPPPSVPDDHPSVDGRSCTSCHDSPSGPSEDDDDDEWDDDDDEDEDEDD